MLKAQEPGSVLVHDTVKRNVYLEVGFDGPIETVAKTAPVKVTREVRTARQVMSPIECRGFVAQWDTRLSQLILHGATQFPHVVRTGLAQVLQMPEDRRFGVVSPDVGGGFGYKAILAAEEICLCWLALRCGYPVRWLEDRREQLTANANCREHHYRMTAYADSTARSSPSMPRPRSIPAPTRPTRSPRRSSLRRSARSFPGPTIFRSIAARLRRSRPTRRRNCLTAGWRGPASAMPWS